MNFVQSTSVDGEQAWMKENVLALLEAMLAWEQEVENALEYCGVKVKLSDDRKFIFFKVSKSPKNAGKEARI